MKQDDPSSSASPDPQAGLKSVVHTLRVKEQEHLDWAKHASNQSDKMKEFYQARKFAEMAKDLEREIATMEAKRGTAGDT